MLLLVYEIISAKDTEDDHAGKHWTSRLNLSISGAVASRDILNEKKSLNPFVGKDELEHRSNLEKLLAVYV
jgi:hypothetical protein